MSKFVGLVISKKMTGTGVLSTYTKFFNHKYNIYVRRKTKIFYDDPKNETDVGDVLQIINSGKKISKKKAFIIDKIIQKNGLAVAMRQEVADKEALLRLQQIERELLKEDRTKVKVNQVVKDVSPSQ
jgi:ribosomal protein S17